VLGEERTKADCLRPNSIYVAEEEALTMGRFRGLVEA
jgi:hypothetical protein